MTVVTACPLLVCAALALQAEPGSTETGAASVRATPPRAGGTDILKVIPSDASLVVVVRDLGTFDAKVRATLEKLDLPFSPFAALKGWLEIATGLDDHGSAAMVFLPKSASAGRRPDMVLLLPTVDRADLLAFLNPQQLSDGNAKVSLRGHETYAATKDNYTLLGPDLRVVRSVSGARPGIEDRWSADQVARFHANDVSLWLEPTALGLGSWETAELWSPFFALAGTSIRAMRPNSVQLSARMDAAGIALELLAQVPPAPATPPRPEDSPSLLTGLPDEPVVFAFGALGNGEREPWGTFLQAMISYLTKAGICSAGRTDGFVDAATTAQAMVQSVAASISLLPSDDPGVLALTTVMRLQGDAAPLVQQIERTVETLKYGVLSNPAYNAVLQRIEYRRAAETDGGLTVDHIVVDLSGYETEDAEKVRSFIGGDRLVFRVSVVEPGQVVVAFGGGIERFMRIVDAVRAEEAPLAARLKAKAPADETSPPPWFQGYLAVDRLSRLARRLQALTGKPTAFPIVGGVPSPVVITAHRPDSSTSRFDFFIPLELMAAIKEAWASSSARTVLESR